MADAVAGVVGAGHEPAVTEERPVAGEAADVVDLEADRERAGLANAGDPEQALDVGVGDEVGHERTLQPLDLGVQELGLLDVGLGLELPERVELAHVADVVLLQQPGDRVLGGHSALDELEPGPEHVAQGAHLVGDHVGLGQEVGPQKMGQHLRVGAVGLDLGGRDGLDALGVSEREVDDAVKRVSYPVPPGRALDGGGVAPGLLGEVGEEGLRPAGHLGRGHDGAGGVEGRRGDGALVEVESGEVVGRHGSGGEWDPEDGILIGMIPEGRTETALPIRRAEIQSWGPAVYSGVAYPEDGGPLVFWVGEPFPVTE